MQKDLSKLEKKIKTKFKNQEILKQSLTHRSYLNEHPSIKMEHNERLEFLGDAVLEIITTEYLYEKYPNPEGELTNWRAALVNAKMLAEVGKELDLESFLYLSHGEAKDKNQKARNYILANAMEALIGAIYLDGGFKEAKKFIAQNILKKLPHILKHKLYVDPKSYFQEQAQEKVGITPSYQVLSESGPDHNKNFVIGVFLEDELVAKGDGSSKQEAQVKAAENGLEAKAW